MNEILKVVEYRGDVRQYLGTPEAQPDADLMSMVRARTCAPPSVRRSSRPAAPNIAVVAEGMPGHGSERSQVAITVVPLSLAGIGQHFLILIRTSSRRAGRRSFRSRLRANRRRGSARRPSRKTAQLKQELRTTREYLQSVIEELRSTNEEAQSANEELQSTNEEMQTSKEELQSVERGTAHHQRGDAEPQHGSQRRSTTT